jgi:hypothetical protein
MQWDEQNKISVAYILIFLNQLNLLYIYICLYL